VACALAAGLAAGCADTPGKQLCDAIAKRDVAAVRRVLATEIDMQRDVGGCVPVAAVFGEATPKDDALTQIGVELVKAGLPATASWEAPGASARVTAVEAAARNGNLQLLRALAAVGLDFSSPAATKGLTVAALAGHLPVVTFFVEEGVPLEPLMSPDLVDETLAASALANGHEAVSRYLEETIAAREAIAAARAAAAAAAAADAADKP
jgi:hypothetical protein